MDSLWGQFSFRTLRVSISFFIFNLISFLFPADDLFTVTDHDLRNERAKEDPNYVDTSYAKELYFPDDQIVIFPSTIGITGEVHQNMGFKIDNDYGNLVKKGTEKQNDDEFDIQSELSNMTPANIMRRKTSLKLYQ